MTLITINGISLDPVSQAHALAAANLVSGDASQSNYILIQTAKPLSGDQKAQLSARMVVIHEYVADNTYVCGYRPSDLAAIRKLPFVVWADVYLQAFKVAPNLQHPVTGLGRYVVPPAAAPSVSRLTRQVDAMLHHDVDPNSDALKKQIAAAAGLDPDQLSIGRHKIRLTIEERNLDDLAAIDEVRQIEEVVPNQLFNNEARQILNAHVFVNGTTYEGAGQVIAIADTGFDKGSTSSVHPAFTGRVAKLYALGRTMPDKMDDPDGHGTHVAGSALGDGSSSAMGITIQGTAPKATLVLQSLFVDSSNKLGGTPADLNDLFEPPYLNDGARVHSNSWGAGPLGLAYSAASGEIDEFVWNNQDCVICFAAGNGAIDGDANGVVDPGSIGSQPAAKNCIAVGASENNRPHLETKTYGSFIWDGGVKYTANPIHDDHMADHPEGMAPFSRRGPTKENRFKPDLVAPGTSVLSTRSSVAAAVPANKQIWGMSVDADYFYEGGTSMAAPLVAGGAAVLRECLVKNGLSTPSAALIKALLINGAVELVGQYSPSEAGPSPNNNSGFGRVNLAGSVIIPGPNPDGGFGDGGPLNQGDEDTIDVFVPRPPDVPHVASVGTPFGGGGTTAVSPSLKVTLVWSDPTGTALQNDLDLIVRTPDGQERHGNMGTSTGFDRLNNVEQVVWDNIPPGDVKIVVRAERITRFAQPYAYVWRIS